MLLSRPAILRRRAEGHIVIDPFDPRHLSTASYDVTLGPYYFREIDPLLGPTLYNPYDEEHVRRVWGTEPHEATLVRDLESAHRGMRLVGLKDDDRVILIRPGETILCHTQEFIGGSSDRVCTMMKARSSLGRNFIEVCKCAGWGDIPYFNRWTMEVTNNSLRYTIPLVVGRRIAQIAFFETEPLGTETNYAREGKYQDTMSLQALKDSWHPRMMLPKMYLDFEAREANQVRGQAEGGGGT